jgi:pimeloyl-ACP methyl ester carboxylesterase
MTGPAMDRPALEKRTIVRTVSVDGPPPATPRSKRSRPPAASRVTRVTFGMLERAAPRLGSRWALRLWCTLPRASAKHAPRAPVTEPGRVVELPLGSGDRTFVAEVWGENGSPVVCLMHGWGGDRGQLGAFVAPLVEAGYRVVAPDAPSHGRSAPGSFGRGRSLVTEFLAVLAAVDRGLGAAHGIVAHSVGASAAAVAVLDGLPVGRLVLIAPASSPRVFAPGFAASLGLGERTVAGLLRRLEQRLGRPMADFDIAQRAREAAESRLCAPGSAAGSATDPGCLPALLVVHDREDRQVPYTQGTLIAEAWRGAELLSTSGQGHRRILSDPEVVRAAAAFLGAPGRGETTVDGARAVPGQTSGWPT